jgi:uncharacterized protein YdhG (YjbR/CyaY superfamily)
MARNTAPTVAQYLKDLPAERRKVMARVRATIRAHLPNGYEEAVNFGMIAWQVPLSRYPDTYNKQPLLYVALAAQKNNYAVYLNAVYGDPALDAWWRAGYIKAGKKLDMGKSCVRFKTLDDLPLALLGDCIAKVPVERYIARYEEVKGPPTKGARKRRKA